MKLVSPQVTLIPQEETFKGVFKIIELAGRTAYKSEDRITEDSAEKFVKMLQTRGHNAALEHGTIYFKYKCKWEGDALTEFYERNPYSKVTFEIDKDYYEDGWLMTTFFITTNYRVIVENDRLDDLKFICNPTDNIKRYTFKIVCSRAIANEFVRHRVFSFLQESTRFCNYSKDKFGGELTYVIPQKLSMLPVGRYVIENGVYNYISPTNDSSFKLSSDKIYNLGEITTWLDSLNYSSNKYLTLLNEYKWKPEEARGVLPLDLKTELVMTGTIDEWHEFFKLRTANDAHPDARYLAKRIQDVLHGL